MSCSFEISLNLNLKRLLGRVFLYCVQVADPKIDR